MLVSVDTVLGFFWLRCWVRFHHDCCFAWIGLTFVGGETTLEVCQFILGDSVCFLGLSSQM